MHLRNEIPPVEIVIDLLRCGPFKRFLPKKTGGGSVTHFALDTTGVVPELPELPGPGFHVEQRETRGSVVKASRIDSSGEIR